MKTSQKRAISYAIMKRKKANQEKYLDEHNLVEDYKNSKYKTMTNYLLYVHGIRIW